MRESDLITKAYSIFLYGNGEVVLNDLKKRFQGKLVKGDKEATYQSMVERGVVEHIEEMARKSKNIAIGEDHHAG